MRGIPIVIEIIDKEKCCGCSACVNICPKSCIQMIEDEEGFLYPVVEKNVCIRCGECERICPILHFEKKNEYEQRAFIIQNKNKQILKESTAGGAFTSIAKYVLEQGGVVFGVEMTDKYEIRHSYVESIEDLQKYRNSKYVQSNIGFSYRITKEFLNKGRLVCFSGTPCQIEGLIHYLNKKYENLILVDVVCRAVPSPGVWKKYISSVVESNGEQKSVRFRDKTLGYQYSTMELIGKNGKINRGGIESQQWLRMFFSGMIIRPSCTDCRFRLKDRRSDFTIWDCFTVHDIDPKFDENCGTTRIIVQSEKGNAIFEKIKEEFIYQEISVDIAVENVKEMEESPIIHLKRKEFFEDYKRMTVPKLMNKYFPIGVKQLTKKYVRIILNFIGADIYVKRIVRKIKNR